MATDVLEEPQRDALIRMAFNDLFQQIDYRTLVVKDHLLKIGSFVMSPKMHIDKSATFSGTNLFDFLNRDVALKQTEGNILEIVGFYKK